MKIWFTKTRGKPQVPAGMILALVCGFLLVFPIWALAQTVGAPPLDEEIAAALEALQKDEAARTERHLLHEITGLVVEETMTKTGYDFYEAFFLQWEPPDVHITDYYNILITEKASPIWGSQVEVRVGETTVFSRMLRPRGAEIEEAVQEALQITLEYLQNYEQYQLRSPDLLGSGI